LKVHPDSLFEYGTDHLLQLYIDALSAQGKEREAAQVRSNLNALIANARAYQITLYPHIAKLLPAPDLIEISQAVDKRMSGIRKSMRYEKYRSIAIERACAWNPDEREPAIISALVELELLDNPDSTAAKKEIANLVTTGWLQSPTALV